MASEEGRADALLKAHRVCGKGGGEGGSPCWSYVRHVFFFPFRAPDTRVPKHVKGFQLSVLDLTRLRQRGRRHHHGERGCRESWRRVRRRTSEHANPLSVVGGGVPALSGTLSTLHSRFCRGRELVVTAQLVRYGILQGFP